MFKTQKTTSLTTMFLSLGLVLILTSVPTVFVHAGTLDGTVEVSTEDGPRSLTGTTVLVEGIPPKLEPDRERLIDQVSQSFEPHVLVTQTGREVEFMNSEMTSHNVRLVRQEDNKQLMNKMTFSGQSTSYTFEESGIVAVRCDIHPSMLAYTVVVDEPFLSTKTVDDGTFSLDLPEELTGKVTVRAWDEDHGYSSPTPLQIENGSVDGPIEIVYK